AREIIRRDLKIVWSFRGRVDQINDETLKIAKTSGCHQILFGVETGTDEGLRLIKKRITTEQAINGVRLTRKHGIETNTNWIIGFPFEKSKEDVMKTIDFAVKVSSDYAQFNILIPYYGTEIFKDGVEKGVLDKDFWINYVKTPVPKALIPVWNEYLSREELGALLKKCYQRFYFRPKQFLRNLTKTTNLRHLKSKIKGFAVLLGLGGYKMRKAADCKGERPPSPMCGVSMKQVAKGERCATVDNER
ncbi:MAG: radical SAM protein, partial [Candidatus Omnitrophica bacterium]|nr:radical SAM protein [Candidatus Omnitrophota bacterium]